MVANVAVFLFNILKLKFYVIHFKFYFGGVLNTQNTSPALPLLFLGRRRVSFPQLVVYSAEIRPPYD